MMDRRKQLQAAQACLEEGKKALADLYAHDRPTVHQRRRVSELAAEVQRLRTQLVADDELRVS